MRIESMVPNWKMVLNTTEFLTVADVDSFFGLIERRPEDIVWIPGMVMVAPEGVDEDPTYAQPLVDQLKYGYLELESTTLPLSERSRFRHRLATMPYEAGRHHLAGGTRYVGYSGDALVLHLKGSPFNEQFVGRK
jgi:hypothetical protein